MCNISCFLYLEYSSDFQSCLPTHAMYVLWFMRNPDRYCENLSLPYVLILEEISFSKTFDNLDNVITGR